jgi:hypothetical protein
MLQEGNEKFAPDEEYKNVAPADKVIEKYGHPKDLPRYTPSFLFVLFFLLFFSLSLPFFRYPLPFFLSLTDTVCSRALFLARIFCPFSLFITIQNFASLLFFFLFFFCFFFFFLFFFCFIFFFLFFFTIRKTFVRVKYCKCGFVIL